MSFGKWFREADNVCIRVTGVGVRDMEDYRWRDCYEDELDPEEAVYGFLSENGYFRQFPQLREKFSFSESTEEDR